MHSAHCAHAHIHTQTHAHTRAKAFINAHILIHTYIHNYAHKRLHSQTQACNLNTKANIQTCSYMWRCTSVYILPHTLIETIQHWAHTHMLMLSSQTYTRSYKLSCISTFSRTFPLTHPNTHIHIHTFIPLHTIKYCHSHTL